MITEPQHRVAYIHLRVKIHSTLLHFKNCVLDSLSESSKLSPVLESVTHQAEGDKGC